MMTRVEVFEEILKQIKDDELLDYRLRDIRVGWTDSESGRQEASLVRTLEVVCDEHFKHACWSYVEVFVADGAQEHGGS